jgi:hypothetical protein
VINLDALIGETADRELIYKGESFALPSEIPGECLAPLLDEDLGLLERIVALFDDDGEDSDKGFIDVALEMIQGEPRYPLRVLAAVKESFAILLGDEYDRFAAKRPGLNAYVHIALALPGEYGLDLADFFGSSESSENGGTDSSTTSQPSTDSTPETSGDTPTPESQPESVAAEPLPADLTPQTPATDAQQPSTEPAPESV